MLGVKQPFSMRTCTDSGIVSLLSLSLQSGFTRSIFRISWRQFLKLHIKFAAAVFLWDRLTNMLLPFSIFESLGPYAGQSGHGVAVILLILVLKAKFLPPARKSFPFCANLSILMLYMVTQRSPTSVWHTASKRKGVCASGKGGLIYNILYLIKSYYIYIYVHNTEYITILCNIYI